MASLRIGRPAPAVIEYKHMKFLITDRPNDASMNKFVEELIRRNVHDVVRVCEPTYDSESLEHSGIEVFDYYFNDGQPPPDRIIDEWIKLLRMSFKDRPGTCVAIHCVSGLGRAPVLVALALIEGGMPCQHAVKLIRQKRPGAINQNQLSYLLEYRPKSRLRYRSGPRCCLQ